MASADQIKALIKSHSDSDSDNIDVAPSTVIVEVENSSFFDGREKVKIFPNPSTGNVTVEQEIENYKRLEIYYMNTRLFDLLKRK